MCGACAVGTSGRLCDGGGVCDEERSPLAYHRDRQKPERDEKHCDQPPPFVLWESPHPLEDGRSWGGWLRLAPLRPRSRRRLKVLRIGDSWGSLGAPPLSGGRVHEGTHRPRSPSFLNFGMKRELPRIGSTMKGQVPPPINPATPRSGQGTRDLPTDWKLRVDARITTS